MTDTTDIKALRDEFTTDQWWYKELLEATKQIPGNLDLRRAVIGVIPNLIDQLEAERQRADANEGYFKEMEKYADKLEKAGLQIEAELAALKAKLANPVVLEYRKHDGFTDPEKVRLINAVTDRCAAAIKESGFTVKGDL